MTASIRIRDKTAPVTEDELCLDHDNDDVPTLHDSVEHSFEFSQDDSTDDDLGVVSEFCDPGDDRLDMQLPLTVSGADAAAETPEKVEKPDLEHHVDNGAALADRHEDAGQPTLQDVFNLTRYEPAQLQRALLVLACTFQIIAAAALWRTIGDRVIVTALVPPLVYASIGVAAYLLGMRYLRIHFAQVRVGDKDWLLCEQVVVAADNGIMLKARFGTAYLIWEQLLGVAQDSDYYYLLIEPSQGFKVPKQGVSDPLLKIKLDDLASLTRAKALRSA